MRRAPCDLKHSDHAHREGHAFGAPPMRRLLVLGLAGVALLVAGCGDSIPAARATKATTPAPAIASAIASGISSGISSALVTPSTPATTLSVPTASPHPTVFATSIVVSSTPPWHPPKVHLALTRASGPRNRLIGPGVDAVVTIYTDCTARTELTRRAVAIDTCVTWDVYFIGHSFGGPFAALIHAYNGEVFTWYNSAGVARPYTIKGHQYSHADGPVDIPPAGTTAQFQTCRTANGSQIITYYAVSP